MDKFEYFSGTPEVGIVPRAPHAGPLLQHVYEQEHGRGGFAGKVTHTYHLFSRGGVFREGMATVHPVGLPHGPKPSAQKALMDGQRPRLHNEVGIMADFTNPAQISEYALGLSQPDYMKSWAGYTTDPRFVHRPDRLAEVRSLAEGLADARDELRPRPDTP